ncbi:hypothetical protein D3C78_882140 [compost metagenome]
MLQVCRAVGNALHAIFSLGNRILSKVERAPIMCGQHKITDGVWLDPLHQLMHSDAVSKRLGHFLVINMDIAIMHPIVG